MALKILVIEDDQDILDILEYVLKDDGYEVISSLSSSIIADIESIQPDLILLDEWLKAEERGSELCRQLKTCPNTADIPVLILSAVNPIELVATEAMADGYIKKPFDIDELSRNVRRHMQVSES
ncbi:response regulator transcription factor [Mucilaginibacter sp. Bleaf8]|uniref:response regulator n=1 Tax=Mucilaginibacter sp. Bleaf8 TaxID=2834430 RepID=UPI001BD002EE|nr:response regulator [Mucilaginibacter sp. Bleaf8]MBS7566421.1 response regulator transcription factor [Mucilaginibacter sp. Bleaf8]